jgi:hypothetical protein
VSSEESSNIFYKRLSFIKNLLVKWQNYDDVDEADMDINNSGCEDKVIVIYLTSSCVNWAFFDMSGSD